MLLEYFTKGTENTVTGATWGMEIETDFIFYDGTPISTDVADAILEAGKEREALGCRVQLELGRQKIELSIAPDTNGVHLIHNAQEHLAWLYGEAAKYRARPVFAPVFRSDARLLYVRDWRDQLWVELDGESALEALCRCSSVQFTVSVNPKDAIPVINKLWDWSEQIQSDNGSYAGNERLWYQYIARSKAGYRSDRYAGLRRYADLEDYVRQLEQHDVVMHNGQVVRGKVTDFPDLDVDLFLRSIWWSYRLRRYGDTLTVEIRPQPRCEDRNLYAFLWCDIHDAVCRVIRAI